MEYYLQNYNYKKPKRKGLMILLVVLAIIVFLSFVYSQPIKSTCKNAFNTVSSYNVISHPESYLNKNITVKSARYDVSWKTAGTVIVAQESDGNFIQLRYNYKRWFFCDHSLYADMEGIVLHDSDGYYLNVTKVTCN